MKRQIMTYGDSMSSGPMTLQNDFSQLLESLFVTGVFLLGQQLQCLLELMECDLASETNNQNCRWHLFWALWTRSSGFAEGTWFRMLINRLLILLWKCFWVFHINSSLVNFAPLTKSFPKQGWVIQILELFPIYVGLDFHIMTAAHLPHHVFALHRAYFHDMSRAPVLFWLLGVSCWNSFSIPIIVGLYH